MITVRKIADLELSAASGLVVVGSIVYVAADDEHVLHAYRVVDGCLCGRLSLGLGDQLPVEPNERKRFKADLECLAILPGNQIVALGSGSSPQRQTGVVAQLATQGMPHSPRAVDLAPLYHELHAACAELNIEGAAIAGPVLRLLHRGNGREGNNAVIDLDLGGTLDGLQRGYLTGDILPQIRHSPRLNRS